MSDQGERAEGPAEGAEGVPWLEPDVWQQDGEWMVNRGWGKAGKTLACAVSGPGQTEVV